MASIFDLKTNVSELSSSNEGTSKMEYDQHPPTRDITGDNMANGAIHVRWQTNGARWWIPNRSYLRLRCRLTKGDGVTPLDASDNIAPNMDLAPNLFQSCEFRINDKTISRVADFVPQTDSVDTRLTKSKGWMDSVGEATNWWEPSATKRAAEVSSDGKVNTDDTKETETGRVELGFDAAGADNNNASYVATTGVISFTTGANASPLPVLADTFPVGSFFKYTVSATASTTGVEMEVVELINATSIRVVPNVNVDVAGGNGADDFVRVVKASPADSRQLSEFEVIWTPCLSIFKVGHAMPSGKYELVLNPQTAESLQRRAIESIGANKTPTLPGGAPGDFKFSVVDMYMYVATVEGPRADDITYLLDLEQTRCQSEKVDNSSFQQKNYDVSPSSFALTAAYQDLRAGQDTRISASKLKSWDAAVANDSEELKLNRFFINYAGQNLPAPDADPSFVAGTDYTVQRYAETNIYSGAYFDTGGAQPLQEFHDMGQYLYFSWPRDGTDRSTRVNVHSQFNAADVTNMRVLLFDHSKQVARIKVQDGRVVDVQLEDA